MKSDNLKMFCLGIIVTLLAVIVFRSSEKNSGMLLADSNLGAAGNIIVVALNANEILVTDVLTKTMCVYQYESSKLKLKSARNLKHDLQVSKELSSSRGYSYDDIAKMAGGKKGRRK